MSKENKSKLSLSKKDLIDHVAKESGFSKVQTAETVDHLIQVVKNTLGKGGEIAIAGFLKLEVIVRSAREGRNPQTGQKIKIPAKNAVKTTIYKDLKDSVNK